MHVSLIAVFLIAIGRAKSSFVEHNHRLMNYRGLHEDAPSGHSKLLSPMISKYYNNENNSQCGSRFCRVLGLANPFQNLNVSRHNRSVLQE